MYFNKAINLPFKHAQVTFKSMKSMFFFPLKIIKNHSLKACLSLNSTYI